MKILAIDSSGMPASVAVLTDGILEAEYTVNNKLTHSQTLLPMIDEVSGMINLDTAGLDAIAIAAGPGSFTGLRIGSATVKGLGLALDKPVVEVPTCDALAFNLYRTRGLICPMMDARRSEVYTGIYKFDGDEFVTVMEQIPLPVAKLAAELNRLGQEVTLVGDGVPVYLDRLKELLTVPFYVAPAHLSRQRAGAVAALGARLFAAGKAVPAADHVPTYLRLSQAERERKEREEKGITEGRYGKSTHL